MTVTHAFDQHGPVPAILDRLEKVTKQPGGYWTARCPAHNDKHPSLSVSEGSDGRALIKCHAGCHYEEILTALGMAEDDLFPKEPVIRREIETYKYEDEGGSPLFEVVRFEPKDFRQRRPDGTWGLGETRRVLYRLPQVRAAIELAQPVYIVEGEKDVHAVEKAGATATCNPMGAGKWRAEYTQQLAGATRVLIIADNDDPGIAHAGHVAQHLEEAGIQARILLPATGKDAADHLAAGHTLDELIARLPSAQASPVIVETWREFASKATDDVPCIVEGLWPEGAIGFIASQPKKGKTWLAIGLALSVATGKRYLNMFDIPRARPVLYIALEGHRAALTHRISCLARGLNLDPEQEITNLHFSYKPRGINMADPIWARHVTEAAESIAAELIIVDVLRAAAVIKENSADDFGALVTNLSPLLDGVRSLGFLHHFTKLNESTKDRDPGERMSGSGAMYGALDVGIYITGSDNGARKLRLAFESRDISSPEGLGVELAGKGTGRNGGFNARDKAWWQTTEAPDEDDLDVTAHDIKRWLEENGGEAEVSHLELAFETSDKTIHRRRRHLEELGVEWVYTRGKGRGRYRIKPIQAPDPQLQVTGQDKPDTCPDEPLSGFNPFIHAETTSGQDKPDNEPCPDAESGDLQGKLEPDKPDSPTERRHPVSGASTDDPDDWHDDDIPF